MTPDKKYMSQISTINVDDTDITFTPPVFNRSLFIDENPIINNSNNSLDLFSSEIQQSEMYCYHNNFCDYTDNNSKINTNNRIPTTFDILREFDLDLDETTDLERNCCNTDVDKIYSEIERRNPGVLSTFCTYGIPCPISKVIIKRLIKLSLLYCNKSR